MSEGIVANNVKIPDGDIIAGCAGAYPAYDPYAPPPGRPDKRSASGISLTLENLHYLGHAVLCVTYGERRLLMSDYRRLYIPGGCYFFTQVCWHRHSVFASENAVNLLRAALRQVKLAKAI